MGQDTVYQVFGFIVVISKNYIPIINYFAAYESSFFSIMFVGASIFSTVYLDLNKVLSAETLDVRHILYILCFQWFELLHIMFFGLVLFPCDVV